jgi:NADH-dependent peroxiredoxin subunit C
MVRIGEKVEDFKVDVYQNEAFKELKLSELKGKWVAMFFYPADFTFVCPTELEDAAALYENFKKEGAELISFSTDTKFVHKAWHDVSPAIKKVTYPMAADASGKVSRQFGVYLEDAGLALRGSFVIDPDGVLQCIEVNNLPIGRSMAELLRKVQAAKFVRDNGGEVCPANWKPGSKTLKPGINLVGKI